MTGAEDTPAVAVFLDAPNTYRAACDEGIDFSPERLLSLAGSFGRVSHAFAYLAWKDGVPTEALARRYNQAGFSVRVVPPGYKSKDIDTTMVADIAQVVFEDDIQIIVIVSGDGDFVPAVELARRKGKAIIVAGFDGASSEALRRRAAVFVSLSAPQGTPLIPSAGRAEVSE